MARRPYAPSTDGSRKIDVASLDTDGTSHLRKEAGLEEIEGWGAEVGELGNIQAYAGQHALLVVLQGRDASGKDGAIRKILDFSNIQNAAVHPFKPPTTLERGHDFLWRVHAVAPQKGHIALFNRS